MVGGAHPTSTSTAPIEEVTGPRASSRNGVLEGKINDTGIGLSPRAPQPVKGSNPRAYLDEALAQQGVPEVPAAGEFKQKWSEGGYKYEVRVHPAESQYGKQGAIYRVQRRSQAVDANGQGTGWEFLDSNGQWHPESTLKKGKTGYPNPKYNDQAAQDTHIQL